MNTRLLYDQLLPSTLAQMYVELGMNAHPTSAEYTERESIRKAGIANCGQADFDTMVADYQRELAQ